MERFVQRWSETIAPMIRQWGTDHDRTLLRIAVAGMSIMALLAFKAGFWRLLFDPGPSGAVDLKIVHDGIQHWFSGRPTYIEVKTAVYPPATYLLLWPFLGWLEVTPGRWLWGATTGGALVWLIYLILKESRADTLLERIFIVLILLSMYATGITIGNGQRIIHLLPMLLTGLFLLSPGNHKWYEDLLPAGLVLVTLMVPNISAPFFWMAVFVPRRVRPVIFIAIGYIALTLLAASFQETNIIQVLRSFMGRALKGIEHGSMHGGYANLQTLLINLGMKEWILPVSLTTLGALGFWIYRHRDGERWILLGVTALFARFWAYHRLYNDLLILLPMIALFRIAKRGPFIHGEDVTAGLLLGITILIMCGSARPLSAPSPWNELFKAVHVIVWMMILVFLLHQTLEEKKTKVKQSLVKSPSLHQVRAV